MRKTIICTLIALALCTAMETDAAPTKSKNSPAQASSASEIDSLKSQIFLLQLRVSQLEMASNATAYLDPTKPNKFSRVDSANGVFLISLTSIDPYLDGQRVTIQIGNLLDATYNGFTLEVKYGPRVPDDVAKYGEWQKSVQTHKEDFTDTLKQGSWNSISFVLAPLKAEDLGYLSIAINTDSVSLYTPRN